MTAKIPTVIGLGRLVDFIIRDAQGKRLRVTPTDERWLAWKPDTRDLVVLRPGNGEGTYIEHGAAVRHEKFHGAAPKNIRVMEWPKPRGQVMKLGLIESVTYCASSFNSPLKKSHHWIHQFGDSGKFKHEIVSSHISGQFAKRFMPRLDVDGSGYLLVVRQPGNQFTVTDWILN
jgi:hypothetical protein